LARHWKTSRNEGSAGNKDPVGTKKKFETLAHYNIQNRNKLEK
jgi:hypothetical protein